MANKNAWKVRLFKFWSEWGKPFLVVLVVLSSFRSAVADWNDVPSGSMEPTILEGTSSIRSRPTGSPFTASPARPSVIALTLPRWDRFFTKLR